MKKNFTYLSLISCLFPSLAIAQGEVVNLTPEREQNVIIHEEKAECGYHRPLRVAAGMIGNAPFAWEEYANPEHTKYKSFGLGLHVIDDLSKKLGFTYETTGYASDKEAIKALKMGEIDVLFTTYYRNLGLGTKTVYPGYFLNVFQAYVKKGSSAEKNLSNITNFKDLVGWKGVVRKEENIYSLFKQRMTDLKLKEELGAPTVFKMLIEGKVDYLIGSPYAIESELRRQKLTDEIVPIGGVLDQASLFFTFSTNSNCTKMPEDFKKVLTENPMTNDQIEDILYQMINDWGNRFREEKGLLDKEEEIEKEQKTE